MLEEPRKCYCGREVTDCVCLGADYKPKRQWPPRTDLPTIQEIWNGDKTKSKGTFSEVSED
jgi:hypothetical protein